MKGKNKLVARLATVPVLLSGAVDRLPPGSVVDALALPPELLATHLYQLLADQAAYQAHFAWRAHYSVTSHQSVPSPCNLCQVRMATMTTLGDHHY